MRAAAALLCVAFALSPALAQSPGQSPAQSSAQSAGETDIRAALTQWTQDFNARRADTICDLFARDLIAQYRGAPERGFTRQCGLVTAALADRKRRYHNALAIREILVFGDVAIARVVWTQTVRDIESGRKTVTVEPGLDVFRKEPDGKWRIIRYLAFDE